MYEEAVLLMTSSYLTMALTIDCMIYIQLKSQASEALSLPPNRQYQELLQIQINVNL